MNFSSKKHIRAPAKLNIGLKISGRRQDGYHELVTIMVPITLFDLLEIERVSSGISIVCEGLSAPDGQDNIVYRAAEAFISKSAVNGGVSIRLKKEIPISAGLGGGSSDAAYTLMALNSMWSQPLTSRDLADLALSLGADVPFFLVSAPCVATGIGEVLEPIQEWPQFWYVLITPPIHISTSWVYNNLEIKLTTSGYGFIINKLREKPLDIRNLLENDLETVTASHFPIINELKSALLDAGAEGALMSGSGPTVFGIFRSKELAQSAKRHLSCQNLGDVFSVGEFAIKDWGVVKW
jgi:4-diphosphocytidyl-2-C-methyl-D-erythritol kinase